MSVQGRATAIGSWPGTDVLDSTRTAFGELGEPPHLPYLPELPARGPGADLIGRAATLLVDLAVDLQPSGWRLVDRPGRDLARARAMLREDLDVLAEVADGYTGALKLQVAGPWTLAAGLWLPRLERVVVDAGACRDLVASLAEGVAGHVHEVSRLVPGAQVVLQLDEPRLGDVLAGSLSTASGFGRLRAVEQSLVADGLRSVLEAAAVPTVVHSCAAEPPLAAVLRAGPSAISVDVAQLGQVGWEQVAEAVESGVRLWAGAVPTSSAALRDVPAPVAVAEAVLRPWTRLGLPRTQAADVVVTPACGLAGASPAQARAAKQGARILLDRALS